MPNLSKHPEQATQRSSNRLSNWLLKTMSGSQIGFAIYDRGFHYVGVNSAIAAMNGARPEEHLGQTAPRIIGRTSRIIEPRVDRVFATGQPVYHHEFSAKLPMRTGIGCWIQDYFPLSDEGNRVSHVGILVVEVTEQRRLEATIRHFRGSIASGVTIDGQKPQELIKAGERRRSPVSRKPPLEVPFDTPLADFPSDRLSERELEVLSLLAQGKSHKEVATALTISEKTVETYRSRVKLKLGLNSLVELVHYAIRSGIVKP